MRPAGKNKTKKAVTNPVASYARAICPAAVLLLALQTSVAAADTEPDLRALSLEDLGNIEITSVSKQAERLGDAPAAVYVITNEDIRRSGLTSIPEILRLAPNLQVAQVTANSYAISARGFNSTTANKLLVLIDGRSVYTPLDSGVLWNLQDVMIEDIDRIEVISGPGGTLWGANAVNGVINILTRNSRDTQGGLLSLGGGNRNIDGAARYGGKLGDNATYRLYAKGFEYDQTPRLSGVPTRDAWNKPQGGFRLDWAASGDTLTLQGDHYDGSLEQSVTADEIISGSNLLSRWTHKFLNGSALQMQLYYDRTSLFIPGGSADTLDTYDLDVQHSLNWGGRQEIVWGGGYRLAYDNFTNASGQVFSPAKLSMYWGNVFAQDSISLADRLKLILGLRLETNNYTGLAPLPSARLAWKVTDDALLWTAVSRALRTPSRLDRDLFVLPVLAGGAGFRDEKLTAYEVGYRRQLGSRASLSISTFYNSYDDLRSIEASPSGGLPFVIGNTMEGNSYGIELWGNYKVRDWWRLSAGLNLLRENLHFKPGSRDVGGVAAAGNDPDHQYSLRSSFDVTDTVQLDLAVRGVGSLPSPPVPSYVSLDSRIGWTFLPGLDVSLAGTNLLDQRHREFGALPGASIVGRTVFVALHGRY